MCEFTKSYARWLAEQITNIHISPKRALAFRKQSCFVKAEFQFVNYSPEFLEQITECCHQSIDQILKKCPGCKVTTNQSPCTEVEGCVARTTASTLHKLALIESEEGFFGAITRRWCLPAAEYSIDDLQTELEEIGENNDVTIQQNNSDIYVELRRSKKHDQAIINCILASRRAIELTGGDI